MTIINISGIEIGTNAFSDNENIFLVDCNHVPFENNSMINAFDGCSNLRIVTNINENVENIVQTFSSCYRLFNVSSIPNSVTNMFRTFWMCRKLVNIPPIPNEVKNMFMAFEGCDNLTGNIYIKSENVYNASRCFHYTTATKNVYIPFYTKTYDSFISAGYTTDGSVNGVYIKEDIANYGSIADWYYRKPNYDIVKYIGSSNSVIIPYEIDGNIINSFSGGIFQNNKNIISVDLNNYPFENISDFFDSCSSLIQVTNINDSITAMNSTFANCSNLVNAPKIPNGLTSLYHTFDNCSNLVNVSEIPNGVTNMYYSFANCSNIVNVPDIPNGVTNMYGTFSNCTKLINMPLLPENIIDISFIFNNCSNLTNLINLDYLKI